jgi:hypothetical protein
MGICSCNLLLRLGAVGEVQVGVEVAEIARSRVRQGSKTFEVCKTQGRFIS